MKRAQFRAEQSSLETEKLVIVDECATNLAMTPHYGYSPKGERVYGSVPQNYGENMTLIAALKVEGMLTDSAFLLEGATNTTSFEIFIQKILGPQLKPGQIVVLDNLSAHRSAKIRRAVEERGCQLLFLPPYSPDFSPIELAFSKIKEYLRRIGARTKEALVETVAKALEIVSPEDALGWFKHCGYSPVQ